jgi:hypothetical protein
MFNFCSVLPKSEQKKQYYTPWTGGYLNGWNSFINVMNPNMVVAQVSSLFRPAEATHSFQTESIAVEEVSNGRLFYFFAINNLPGMPIANISQVYSDQNFCAIFTRANYNTFQSLADSMFGINDNERITELVIPDFLCRQNIIVPDDLCSEQLLIANVNLNAGLTTVNVEFLDTSGVLVQGWALRLRSMQVIPYIANSSYLPAGRYSVRITVVSTDQYGGPQIIALASSSIYGWDTGDTSEIHNGIILSR